MSERYAQERTDIAQPRQQAAQVRLYWAMLMKQEFALPPIIAMHGQ